MRPRPPLVRALPRLAAATATATPGPAQLRIGWVRQRRHLDGADQRLAADMVPTARPAG